MKIKQLIVILMLLYVAIVFSIAHAEFPSIEVLNEYRNKLLDFPKCWPSCVSTHYISINIKNNKFIMQVAIDSLDNMAVPLPAINQDVFLIETAHINRIPAKLVITESGILAHVSKGRQEIVITGKVQSDKNFQLRIPITPKYITVEADAFDVIGIDNYKMVGPELLFNKKILSAESAKLEENTLEVLTPTIAPNFVKVTRDVTFGFTWMVKTTVTKVAPKNISLSTSIPLLPSEMVLSQEYKIADGKIFLNFLPEQDVLEWESMLHTSAKFVLTATPSYDIMETWRFNVDPIWHMEYSGIEPINKTDDNFWRPTWQPWPGEKLELTISKPRGATGQTLTLQNSHLNIRPGLRATDIELYLNLTASRAQDYKIKLPQAFTVKKVMLDGNIIPIKINDGLLNLALAPKVQEIKIYGTEAKDLSYYFTNPQFDLTIPGANASLTVENFPQSRWILYLQGPVMGPAVLFWGVLGGILIAAIILARAKVANLHFFDWLLLGIGTCSVQPLLGGVVVLWLCVLDGRSRLINAEFPAFKLMQLAIIVLTSAAIYSLIYAISLGLLGAPEMQVAGNNSYVSAYLSRLNWYQDKTNTVIPHITIISVPIYVYKTLMLAWALWLAWALIRWLRWGWRCFTAIKTW